ncbi:MAG: hypothetical protein BucCj_0550 [Buchnera aphidicola (Ceratovacuna japonica)]
MKLKELIIIKISKGIEKSLPLLKNKLLIEFKFIEYTEVESNENKNNKILLYFIIISRILSYLKI